MCKFDVFLEEISKNDFDRKKYVELVLKDESMRDFIVENMINHPQIMKYYHCFYIISDASDINPELFYKYWDDLVKLLHHSNSYHRDFGLIILANISKGDSQNKFVDIIDDYLELLKDEKHMTAECCVNDVAKVTSIKPELSEKIISHLLNLEHSSRYSDKQKALMMGFIIEGLELVIEKFPDKTSLINFAKRHLISISPKTRKTAKKFLEKYE